MSHYVLDATYLLDFPVTLCVRTFALRHPSKAPRRISVVVSLLSPLTISFVDSSERERNRNVVFTSGSLFPYFPIHL